MPSTFTRSDDAFAVEMDGEYVMMGKEQGAYFGLKDVGAVIWEEIETPKTLEELVDAVVSKYDVAREDCRRDVKAFLDQLVENKIAQAVGE